ncbi:MAG: LytTR family DNA-binding domain-containing protein [Bacteroidota bacterium]
MFQFFKLQKEEKKFFYVVILFLTIVFIISLIQNVIRYGEHETYSVWNTVLYISISLMLFLPFVPISINLNKDAFNKFKDFYWPVSIILIVMTVGIFYLFSSILLHSVGYFDNYTDSQYMRQYFGKDVLYHLLVLSATSIYVFNKSKKNDIKLIKCSLGRKEVDLRSDLISWIEVDDHYLNFHTNDQTYIKRATIGSIAKELEPGFIRIHRKYLVNREEIASKEKRNREEYVVLNSGEKLKIGRSYSPLNW